MSHRRERKDQEKAERRERYNQWYEGLPPSEQAEIMEAYNKMTMKLPSLAIAYPYERFCRQVARVAEQVEKKGGKFSPAMTAAEKVGNLFLRQKEDEIEDNEPECNHSFDGKHCPYCGSDKIVVVKEGK